MRPETPQKLINFVMTCYAAHIIADVLSRQKLIKMDCWLPSFAESFSLHRCVDCPICRHDDGAGVARIIVERRNRRNDKSYAI